MFGKVTATLERIATALERIAQALEYRNEFIKPVVAAPATMSATTDSLERYRVDEPPLFTNGTAVDEAPGANPIKEFLQSRNITIKTLPSEDPADPVINQLSLFLGEHYDGLKRILATIKRNMQHGNFFSETIKNYPQQTVSDITQFCINLHKVAFLEQYKYFKSPQFVIKAKATTLPKAQKFFAGQWLERFVLQKVESAVTQASKELGEDLDFSYLLNPQIILPNGDDFEMDLIFQVNNRFYWIEAKSGDYQQHIAKYAKLSNLLRLDRYHAIMVLTDVTPDESEKLSNMFGMTIYALHQLEEGLMDTVRKEENVV